MQLTDRITVVGTAYYQVPGEEPKEVNYKFDRACKCIDEQVYERRMKIGPDWQPLDHGWLETVGMILILNNEGKFFDVNPTPQELEIASKKIIEVALNTPTSSVSPINPLLIMAGESLQAQPQNISSVWVRSQHEFCKCSIYLFPR